MHHYYYNVKENPVRYNYIRMEKVKKIVKDKSSAS